jgi:D-glycero-alpha-D-manno-heptose-7-phosphate kinase
MHSIRSRAPLRLGLAGGGTDVSPFCDLYGGYVLNATIDRYAYTLLKSVESKGGKCQVTFIAADQGASSEFDGREICSNEFQLGGPLLLHQAVYRKMINQFHNGKAIPVEVTTFCDAPAGSGLGSSSTVVVSMIRAYVELFNLPLDDHEIADLAVQIERVDCALRGGRQDQYSATFGGFNFMEFYADDRIIVNPLRIKNWIISELEASLVLFYTGVSRESARIISDQSKNISEGIPKALEAMHALKQEAVTMKASLLRGDFKEIVEGMRQGWINKKRSADTVSNPHIDEIYDEAVKAGALSGKVSGAGGGGFMMFFVAPEKRMSVIRTLSKFSGQVSNCHFTKHGAQAWGIK